MSFFKNHLNNQRGISKLGFVFFGSILGALLFVGYNVGPFFYYYYDILGQMEAQAKKANINTDAEIKQFLLERIKKNNIPIDGPDDLKINRLDNKIIIEMAYDEVFYVEFDEEHSYDIHVFHFNPHVEVPLPEKKFRRGR